MPWQKVTQGLEHRIKSSGDTLKKTGRERWEVKQRGEDSYVIRKKLEGGWTIRDGDGVSRIEGDDVKICIYGPKRSGWFTQVEWSGYWTSATPSVRPSAG